MRSGEQVLVHAAAGGVGLAAVQLAAAFGARVIATASRPKHAFLGRLEVLDAVIDYNDADWDDQVREASGGGVDVVLDGIGEDNFRKSLHTLAFGGRLAAFGLASAMTCLRGRSTPTSAGVSRSRTRATRTAHFTSGGTSGSWCSRSADHAGVDAMTPTRPKSTWALMA